MIFSTGLKEYTKRVNEALTGTQFDELSKIAEAILAARDNKKWIFLAGNGGSASTASHFANDMVKGLSIGDKTRFKAKALCDPTPIMTALANDYSYEVVFSEQLKNYASSGDLLIVFSGSGNSPNIISAAKYAKETGMRVISFTGRDGGKIKDLCDLCCIAATDCMEEIEDIHVIWIHALATVLRASIKENN